MHIRELNHAAFDGARSGLVVLLLDAVRHDASVGFVGSITHAEAEQYWNEVARALACGNRLLWVAERSGVLVGTVQLDLCQRVNGRNRAEVQKLLVHSSAQGGGIASALMAALEACALARERGLLFLDTEAGSKAEPFYRACGYTCIGGLPEYACAPDGSWNSNAIYYKSLFLRAPP